MSATPNYSRSAERDGARSILEAAARLFADEGYESVSVARIAERAGVCKANVFHHFASKEALYLAVIQRVSTEHAERAEALLDQPGPSAYKIRQLFTFELNWMLNQGTEAQLLLRECSDQGHPQARQLTQEVFKRNFLAVNALFEQGRAHGEFRSDIEPAAVTLILIAANHFFMNHRQGLRNAPEAGELINPEVYADQICSIVLDGIISRAPAPSEPRRVARRAPQPKTKPKSRKPSR